MFSQTTEGGEASGEASNSAKEKLLIASNKEPDLSATLAADKNQPATAPQETNDNPTYNYPFLTLNIQTE